MTEPPYTAPAARGAKPRRRVWGWIGVGIVWLVAVGLTYVLDGARWSLVHEYGIETTSFWPEVERMASMSIVTIALVTLAVWLTLGRLGHARWALVAAPVLAVTVVSIGVWGDYHAYALRQADPAYREPTTGSLTAELVLGGTRRNWGPPLTSGTVTFAGPTTKKVTVGADGEAKVDLPPGTYRLTATSPDYKNGKQTCSAVGTVGVEVNAWQLIPVFCKTG